MSERIKEYFKGKKVIIATPFYKMLCNSPYVTSLVSTLHLCWELGIEATLMKVDGDAYVGRARNSLITHVYDNTDATDLVFIDSDLEWTPEDFIRLLSHPVELIGGTYPQQNAWRTWAHRNFCDENGIPHGDLKSKTILCEAIPAGFMRISRAAMDRMHEKYPIKGLVPGSATKKPTYNWFGEMFEDFVFCKRFRAAGGDVWLEPNITFKHYGPYGWEGNFYDYLTHQPGGINYRSKNEIPLVSIIIPCYNYGHYLPLAVSSAVKQTYCNIEVIIVDDGSTDNTSEVAEHLVSTYPNVKFIHQDNEGVCSARNTGIRFSNGDWIICLDADDEILPTYVSKCLDYIDFYDLIGACQQEIGDSHNLWPMLEKPTFEQVIESNQINCSAMFSRKAYDTVNGWQELGIPNAGYEDWFMWARILKAGFKAYNVQEPLFLYRKHGKSMVDKAIEKHDELKAKIQEIVR